MFNQTILSVYGEKGKNWLTKLPKLVQELSTLWHLRDLKPIPNLSFNYVLSGFQQEKPIILKLGLDDMALTREANALNAFCSCAVVKLLAARKGALLLQRAIPGYSLKNQWLEHAESLTIACQLISQLTQAQLPKENKFPHIRDWLAILDKNWEIPTHYLEKSREYRDYLLKTSQQDHLLHGDLHHDNILKNDNDWLAIDPKGVIGELTYEVAAFIRNPIPELLESKAAWRIIDRRMTGFASLLNLDLSRIAQWCFVQAVLAWCWSLEDRLDDGYFRELTEIFAKSCA
ncbi:MULTISPECIES: aminoglycoside phosphotransferase family protein [Legionella]|uniref:Aminoglycoside/hydroxyurea antibiotic resistance kinase n=1 Tax=Legionella maceachernii TaxID=466 RepID=A0A0W0WG04_9GAMM|nr:aminoglycoside phosphotransferase family protein [Legionella maceachernii]KTD31250.1 Aminoglycoside/hydroxyurea antibiotic resistance kinase [Legionella maceachernii]SKA30525.1 streptomycin 6-kinase [Legionella maceachernii]SUP01735.1 Aminoglycoside/hydroxyurea antibiotic resistance kinase [Legionella maceachernii]